MNWLVRRACAAAVVRPPTGTPPMVVLGGRRRGNWKVDARLVAVTTIAPMAQMDAMAKLARANELRPGRNDLRGLRL